MKVIGLGHRIRGLTGSRLVTMGGDFFWVTGTETTVDLNMTTTGTANETGIFITRGTARTETTTARAARRTMTEFTFTAHRVYGEFAFTQPSVFGIARDNVSPAVGFEIEALAS